MQFYSHSAILPKWRLCQKLYRAGELEGVESMKVSTMHPHHSGGSGVIILYCGPTDDEERVKKIGRMIIQKTRYKNPGNRMFYKTDLATLRKEYRNLYEIPIPDDTHAQNNEKDKDQDKEDAKDSK